MNEYTQMEIYDEKLHQPSVRRDFGCANDWGEDVPPLVERCVAQQHPQRRRTVRRWQTIVECDICDYTFWLDSSD